MINPNWPVIQGLIIAIVLGFGVGPLVKYVGDSLPLPPPSEATRQQWTQLAGRNTGGAWIGFLERLIFFAACWWLAWLFLAGWLVFKLGFYWQSANVAALPEKLPESNDLGYFIAKRHLATHHVATVLVGTGANIVCALIGVSLGRWITW